MGDQTTFVLILIVDVGLDVAAVEAIVVHFAVETAAAWRIHSA